MMSSQDVRVKVKAPDSTAIRSTSVSETLTTITEREDEVSEPETLNRRSLSCPLQGSARHHVCSRKAMHQIKRNSCDVPAEDPLKSRQ